MVKLAKIFFWRNFLCILYFVQWEIMHMCINWYQALFFSCYYPYRSLVCVDTFWPYHLYCLLFILVIHYDCTVKLELPRTDCSEKFSYVWLNNHYPCGVQARKLNIKQYLALLSTIDRHGQFKSTIISSSKSSEHNACGRERECIKCVIYPM